MQRLVCPRSRPCYRLPEVGVQRQPDARLAEIELLAGLGFEAVVGVPGFPEAAGLPTGVTQGAVHGERMLARSADFLFRDECPIVPQSAAFERPWKADLTAPSSLTPRLSNWARPRSNPTPTCGSG